MLLASALRPFVKCGQQALAVFLVAEALAISMAWFSIMPGPARLPSLQ